VDQHWGSSEGLPENTVFSLIQSRDGFLWVGTGKGLARFDGKRFTVFHPGNTPNLKGDSISCLFEDSRGRFWIGTAGAGVTWVSGTNIDNLPIGRGVGGGRLVSACEDSAGAVWLYTSAGELWRYHGNSHELVAPSIEPQSQESCRAIAWEKGGPVWLSSQHYVDRVEIQPAGTNSVPGHDEFFAPAGVQHLLASRGGGLWLFAGNDIRKLQAGNSVSDLGAFPWSADTSVSCACEDREGNLVIGTTGDGVYWYDASGRAAHISTAEGLSQNSILSVCVDDDGNLWVGTNGHGLNRVKRRAFNVGADTSGWVVLSAAADRKGGVWFGVSGHAASYWDGTNRHDYTLPDGLKPNGSAVFVDHDGRVWLGVSRFAFQKLFRFENGAFQPAPGSEIIRGDVTAIFEDRSSNIWVGTELGLARGDGAQWRLFTTTNGLSANFVTAIAEDPDGSLWIGTRDGGLNRLRNGQFTTFRKTPGGLPGDDISSLLVDKTGNLWIGTDWAGLARLRGGKWTVFSTRDGMASPSIGYLVEDKESNLWMGSAEGLMRAPEQSLNDFADGRASSIVCRIYGIPDGLPTGECTAGSQPGACLAPDGKLWFPTILGLVTNEPRSLVMNSNPPSVILDSVRIEDEEQLQPSFSAPALATVTLRPGQRRLDIDFTCLDLAAPDRVHFRYMLEGHDTRWTPGTGNEGHAAYSKLSAGACTFRVSACNEDNQCDEKALALRVIVLPPFWQTWWFIALSSAVLLGLLVGSVYVVATQRLQRQLARMRQQEALEKERARIARDLHDQLGANLTQVTLLGEMAESDREHPSEVESLARQICQTARETTRALDEIVWAVNPSNDTLEGLVNYACKYAQEYLELAGVRYRFDVPVKLPEAAIAPEVRHNVFLAFKEAVNNVVRHAKATEARIRLHLDGSSFTLAVEDNGRGIAGMDEKAAQSRNGLKNMRKRMTDIHGAFSIQPAPQQGTVVLLTAPLNR
jgi:signal transduction histidine kinase/ligand-binding sensor domain-containing protein